MCVCLRIYQFSSKIVTRESHWERLSLVATGSLSSQRSPTKAVSHCWAWGKNPVVGSCSVPQAGCLSIPIRCLKPGMFLESRWSLIRDESLEMLLLISGSNQWRQGSKPSPQQGGRGGQAKRKAPPRPRPFIWASRRGPYRLLMLVRAIGRALQMKVLTQAIRIPVKLALKPTLIDTISSTEGLSNAPVHPVTHR